MRTKPVSRTVELSRVRQLAASGAARSIRVAARLSQSDVARAVGVSVPAVCRWESGARCPRGSAAVRYGRLLARLLEERV